tara:strand:- start:1598 stop:1918 length:321 start_codon:yes stop_codon:yes gene_type:complete
MATGYVTVPRKLSQDIAHKIIENHLAACVNIVECNSVYEWENEIQNEKEAILIIKTSEQKFEDLVLEIKNWIPYEIPCIERFDEDWIDGKFKEWRDEFVDVRRKST